jgi:hypothetical protein
MRRLSFAFALTALATAVYWAPPAAIAQEGGRLAIVSPRAGSTISSDVRVVVRLVGGAGEVPFSLQLDGAPTPVQGAEGSDTPVAAPGEDAIIILPGVPEGPHQVQAVPLSSTQARASAPVSFVVASSGLSVQAILIAAAIIGLLILYRRRILAPWADRYEQRPPTERTEP